VTDLSARTLPPRGSCLAVPASSARKLKKAAELAADEIVIDLEDAVVPAGKEEAREAALAALAAPQWERRTVAVRVNGPRTPWCHRDLEMLAGLAGQPLSVVLPKVESAGDLAFAERLLDGVEAAAGRLSPLRLQALIETAAGLGAVGEIAASCERLDALILGYADLTASLGRAPRLAPERWIGAQESVLVAARANGLQAIDGPFLGVEPDDSFLAAARHAAELGFDGKWAIHPSQVEALNVCFAPSPAEVERARATIAALEQVDHGAVALDGEMIDEASRLAAERLLARAARPRR